MTTVGHNQPPSNIDFAVETGAALSSWLKEHPVVQSEEDARAGKLLVDRSKAALAEMESERKGRVAPLNEQVAKINDEYRVPRESLTSIHNILLGRLDDYRIVEEQRRAKAAEEARRAALEAEVAARAAESMEREAISDAATGVEADVALATLEADQAYSRFEKASREAQRAEKDTKVKIGGGFNRALSAKTKETLEVADWKAAIAEMGLTEDIIEAIIKSARAWRRITGDLPAGITSKQERRL